MQISPAFLLTTLTALASLAFSPAHAAGPLADREAWQNLQTFDARQAFEVYGPPTLENAALYSEETVLWLDIVGNFEDVADDEDEFAFVAEAFSVPVSEFRPSSLRVSEEASDDVFADDPLPDETDSTSVYVNAIRPSFLPGPPLKPRKLEDVKLGEGAMPALFKPVEPPKPDSGGADTPAAAGTAKSETKSATAGGAKVPAAAGAAKAQGKATAGTGDNAAEDKEPPAGSINAPAKPVMLSTDEETLGALRQAVKDLGLEKQLNFEATTGGASQALARMSDEEMAGITQANKQKLTTTTASVMEAPRETVKEVPEKAAATEEKAPAAAKKVNAQAKPKKSKKPPVKRKKKRPVKIQTETAPTGSEAEPRPVKTEAASQPEKQAEENP